MAITSFNKFDNAALIANFADIASNGYEFAVLRTDFDGDGVTLPSSDDWQRLSGFAAGDFITSNAQIFSATNGAIHMEQANCNGYVVMAQIGGNWTDAGTSSILARVAVDGPTISGRVAFAKMARPAAAGFNLPLIGGGKGGSDNTITTGMDWAIEMSSNGQSGVNPQFYTLAVIVF